MVDLFDMQVLSAYCSPLEFSLGYIEFGWEYYFLFPPLELDYCCLCVVEEHMYFKKCLLVALIRFGLRL